MIELKNEWNQEEYITWKIKWKLKHEWIMRWRKGKLINETINRYKCIK